MRFRQRRPSRARSNESVGLGIVSLLHMSITREPLSRYVRSARGQILARQHRLAAWWRTYERQVDDHIVSRLLIRSVTSYATHACGLFAGAIAFFGVLSLFPLLLLLVTLVAVGVERSDATALVVNQVSAFFPASADLVIQTIDTVTSTGPAFLSLGLAGLLWSSMGVFLALGYALERIWNARDRNILIQYGLSAGLALSVGLVALASLVASALVDLAQVLDGVFPWFHVPSVGLLTLVASNGVNLVVVSAAVAVVYRALPNTYVEWRDVVGPALAVALLGGAARFGFAWYLTAIGRFNLIYGPLAAIAGLMLWIFLAAVLLLFGAEFSHQLALLRADRGWRRVKPG